MKKLVGLAGVLLLGYLVAGCNAIGVTDADGVYVRVTNASSIDFSSVYLNFPGGEATFGEIEAGRSSAYQTIEAAYHYGFIEVEAQGKLYRLVPIDYFGEEPLSSGRYTYQLDVAGDDLTLEFEPDR